MNNCPQSIIPIITEDPCHGEQISTNCTILPIAITYLNLPPNSTVTTVLNAYLLSLVDARNRIAVLETQGANFETRITALENA
jgi:hypothetical protein|nr:MAG TPA: hypothetical protein [Caudoviricetes sp.]